MSPASPSPGSPTATTSARPPTTWSPIGEAGMVGLGLGNSPAAMAAAGGRRRSSAPIRSPRSFRVAGSGARHRPVAVGGRSRQTDGRRHEGEGDPAGWALDGDGQPTTDAKAGLDGTMLPMGGAKGAMLALIVELLVTALSGAAFGFEAELVLRRRRQPAADRPGVPRHRSRSAGRARRSILRGSRRWSRR